MVDKLYYRANSCSRLRPIAHFVVEMQLFVFNRTTPPIIKLQYKGIAMHAYGISAYYTCARKLTNFSVSCPKGGFPLTHHEIRDLTANLLTEVCNDICIEPSLQPTISGALNGSSSNTQDGARLDMMYGFLTLILLSTDTPSCDPAIESKSL